jgi:predicted outer membrane protein
MNDPKPCGEECALRLRMMTDMLEATRSASARLVLSKDSLSTDHVVLNQAFARQMVENNEQRKLNYQLREQVEKHKATIRRLNKKLKGRQP